MTILVLAEHEAGALKAATLNAVTAAAKIAQSGSGDIHILVAGATLGAVAASASRIAGVAKVLVADDPLYADGLAEPLAALVAGLAVEYSHVLAPSTSTGKAVMPRAAALLDVAPISDIVAVVASDTFVRPIYAGNALATVRSRDKIVVATVRATGFDAAPAEGGDAVAEMVAAIGSLGASRFVSRQVTQSARPDLTSARIVISGGRGMQSGENFHLLEAVADRLNAAVGASRAAVDAGFVPNDFQVGQTGKIVAPDLYIAVGISGAIQHLAGMKDSKVIVAINKDEEAPIFQVADYGLVADLFKVLPELSAALQSP